MTKRIKKLMMMLLATACISITPSSYIASCELKLGGCSSVKRVKRPQIEQSQVDLHPLDLLSLRLMN